MESMMESPDFFQEMLNMQGLLDNFYDLMAKGDYGEVIMEALSILQKSISLPPLVKNAKDKVKSTALRNNGNMFYKKSEYQKALEYYNMALLVAPKDSDELVLAYSNRSALLFDLKLFQASINDIDTCLSLAYPKHIEEKLKKRRSEANKHLWMENMARTARYHTFVDEYFQFNERRNPQIPCASADVGVIVESHIPTVVAVKEVKVGQLLAVEKAYATALDRQLYFTACHQCHKITLNLFPCENCCHALYCSKDCQNTAFDEHHHVLCAVIEILGDKSRFPISSIAVKAALKLKKQFGSWDELIEATSKLGLERTKDSKISEIFDGNNKFSMLNFRDNCNFLYGKLYNFGFGCAVLIHYLGLLKFFPGHNRPAAKRAFARLVMYFTIHGVYSLTSSTKSVIVNQQTMFCDVGNFNMFPFVGKLRHACEPTVLAVGLNDRIALIAVRPLKPGAELTVAYLGHWLDNHLEVDRRRRNLLSLYQIACDCTICNGDYELIGRTAKPTEAQLRCLQKLQIKEMARSFTMRSIFEIFPKVCKALAFMADSPYCKQYDDVFTLFRKCLLDMQNFHTGNVMLDDQGL